MPVERLLPDAESEALVALAREIATDELKPIASEYEAKSEFPREQFRLLGRSGLLGLPYPQEWGGGAVNYEVYLQVLEELAAAWMTVGVGLSVHTMSCYRLPASAPRSSGKNGCPRCWQASCSAPTRCPRPRPAGTRPHRPLAPNATATTTC